MSLPVRPAAGSGSAATPAADDGDAATPGPRSPPARQQQQQQGLAVRTPGQLARNVRAASVPHRTPTNRPVAAVANNNNNNRSGGNGLSASARRLGAPSVAGRATPHARRAIETFRDRRTAVLNTPGRKKGGGGGGRLASAAAAAARDRRRSGIVEGKGDGPLDALRTLSRRLAPLSQRVVTSSSPGDTPRRDDNSSIAGEVGRRQRDPSGMFLDDDDDDEDSDSGFIKRRPRLSLPIDAGDDDEAELQRPQISGLLDDHTALSVEAPRRAASEQPGGWGRFDRQSLRMSDFFGGRLDLSDEFGPPDDAGGVMPPPFFDDVDDGDRARRDDDTYERLDSPAGRRETLGPGRQSDFGTIEVPLDVDSPFRLEPQINETTEIPGLVFGDDDDDGGNSPLASPDPGRGSPDADDHDLNGYDAASVDGDLEEATTSGATAAFAAAAARRPGERLGAKADKPNKKGLRLSKHGNPVPSLPPAVVKRLAEAMARTSGVVGNAKITPETLRALMQATDWFFEQVGDDLRALAHHAGRKTIETSDVAMLMKRQRQIDSQTTVFSLAQRHLPRELLQELRMPPRALPKKRRREARQAAADDDDET
ncbi:hypothetical protein RB597_009179 [Gaeumannomyces tritici]